MMPANQIRRSGKGSNQYQSRPGPPLRRRWVRRRADVDMDAEQVAWQFDPDREAWEREGFGCRQTLAWRAVGVTRPHDAKMWSNRSPEQARPWVEAGFPPPPENDFYRSFDGTPAEAAAWRDSGWTAESALCFRTQNVDPVDLAQAWWAHGFTTRDANFWVNSGFTAPEAAQCVALNWHPFTAGRARKKGIDPTVTPPADGGLPA